MQCRRDQVRCPILEREDVMVVPDAAIMTTRTMFKEEQYVRLANFLKSGYDREGMPNREVHES